MNLASRIEVSAVRDQDGRSFLVIVKSSTVKRSHALQDVFF